jgi:predicted amidohydrolase
MKIAAAQIESKVGDIKGNLKKHLEMIALAAEHSLHLIVFPEMSITGYCKEEGSTLAVQANSPEILKLTEKAKEHNLVIIVGAPIKIDKELFIGSFILLPTGAIKIYTKQFLHSGEDEFYSSSFHHNPTIKIKNETISFAICADINNKEHAQNAKNNLCSLYIPSIFFTKNGIPEAHELLAKYSSTYSLNILMSNYSGEVYGMKSGGRSAFWNNQGRLVGTLDSENKGLLIIEKQGDNWIKKNIPSFKKSNHATQKTE